MQAPEGGMHCKGSGTPAGQAQAFQQSINGDSTVGAMVLHSVRASNCA